MDDTQRDPPGLPEEHAHRILARAVELDSEHAAQVSLSDLRAAAIEAGIQSEAFDRAAAEYSVDRIPTSESEVADSSLRATLIANLKAVFVFWVAITILTRVDRILPDTWAVSSSLDILACVIGIWFAIRFRAVAVKLGLIGIAAAMVALFAVHVVFGIRAAQGGPTHFAVIIAGILAGSAVALLGRFTVRPGYGPSFSAQVDPTQAGADLEFHRPDTESDRSRPMSLVRVGTV